MTDEDSVRNGRGRLHVYWVLSALATFIYLLFVFMLMMVPGVYSGDKLWLISFAAVLLSVPMIIGIWKFNTSEAPIAVWPLGTVVFVILMLEMAICLIQIVTLMLIVLHNGYEY
jgi:hypothetical protein